jgi:hypothetical protein
MGKVCVEKHGEIKFTIKQLQIEKSNERKNIYDNQGNSIHNPG